MSIIDEIGIKVSCGSTTIHTPSTTLSENTALVALDYATGEGGIPTLRHAAPAGDSTQNT